MIVSQWAVAMGLIALIGSGFYIMKLHADLQTTRHAVELLSMVAQELLQGESDERED